MTNAEFLIQSVFLPVVITLLTLVCTYYFSLRSNKKQRFLEWRKEALVAFAKTLDDSLKENPDLATMPNPREEALKPVYVAIAPLRLFLTRNEIDELAGLINTLKSA